jgi:hypothetical protein
MQYISVLLVNVLFCAIKSYPIFVQTTFLFTKYSYYWKQSICVWKQNRRPNAQNVLGAEWRGDSYDDSS